MIAADLRLADLDPRHWANWWTLAVPPPLWTRPAWALAIVDGDPLTLRDGVIAPVGAVAEAQRRAAAWPAPMPRSLDAGSLARWAQALGVAGVVVVKHDLLSELSREVEAELRHGQDLVAQGLIVTRALKRRAGAGVWTSPALLELLPTPHFEAVQRTFDLLVPDETSLVAYIVDDDRRTLHASLIAHKRGGDLALVTTHRRIQAAVDEASFARAWASQTGKIITAVEAAVARPSLGLFAERAAVMRVLTGAPDQLSRELAARTIVFDPQPVWLTGLLGGAAVASVATRGARMFADFLPAAARERASQMAAKAQTMMRDAGAHPFALLGFDPIELWKSVQHFYRG